MFNRITIVGNLTRDPELKYGTSGTAICNMTVAVNEKVKRGEKWEDETTFLRVVVFGVQAENCEKYLSKGRGVLVDGRLKINKWEKEGVKRETPEIVANTVRFLPGKEQAPAATEPVPENTSELEPF